MIKTLTTMPMSKKTRFRAKELTRSRPAASTGAVNPNVSTASSLGTERPMPRRGLSFQRTERETMVMKVRVDSIRMARAMSENYDSNQMKNEGTERFTYFITSSARVIFHPTGRHVA